MSLCLFLCLNVGCQQSEPPSPTPSSLFTIVLPEQSGVLFSNDIKESEQQNFLSFPYYYNGGGVAVGDINGDQLPDIYFTGNMVGDRLYLNKGDLQFEDITRKAGILKQNLWTTGVSFVDLNQDGRLDIYVCRSGMRGFRNNLLYINQGNNKFEEQAREYGLNDNAYSVQAYFFDYDIDGDLDLYLVNHSSKFFANQEELFSLKGKPEADESDKLYRNDGPSGKSGHLQFTEVSQEAGIQHFGFGLSASIADWNQDGWPDIYVANDFFEPDVLYINQGDGSFRNELEQYLGHTSFSSMGSDAADVNNDGLPDIMVCDMQAADNYRKKAHMASMDIERFNRMIAEGYHYQYMQNTLQLNAGKGRFSEVAEFAGVEETDWSWGPLFFDMDNDGWKDLFISNGIRRDIQYKDILSEVAAKVSDQQQPRSMDLIENFPVERLKNYTFQNQGDFPFIDQSDAWGIDFEGFSTGAAYADLDLDGDLDVILNNLDDVASVYENHTRTMTNAHYLQIELQGSEDNIAGIGAKIEVKTDQGSQYSEIQRSRGFQSSVEAILHIGLGQETKIQEMIVQWPNGNMTRMKDISADQRLLISQENAQKSTDEQQEAPTLIKETSPSPIAFHHTETVYDDFATEILLPHKYSQLGPALATADVNGDGTDDIYIGGAKDQAGALFLQNQDASFSQISVSTWRKDRSFEDMDAAFLDADGDGDKDLYVVSGSNEWEEGAPEYADRLYLNDGTGNFTRNKTALPDIHVSGACVRPVDYDQDGDMDLFVGARMIPGKYPLPASSYMLQNQGGNFTDISPQVSPELRTLGMVSDAHWTDHDKDGDQDLWVVGEWMPITVFENQEGNLHRINIPSLGKTQGWWYSLEAEDMDQDGDMDFIAGNIGLNYKYEASEAEPFQVYAHDFDDNGSLDIVLGYFNQGQLFPLRGRQCSSEQMPYLKEKFPQYASFAKSTLSEVYGSDNLSEALHYEAYQFSSVYIENRGEGEFVVHSLPSQAQFSSVNDIVVMDMNQDGKKDLLLAGNMYQSEAETARNDAGLGLALLGNGTGDFLPLNPMESGFYAPGDVKHLSTLKRASGEDMIVVGNNSGLIQTFILNR
ncbi:MAG: VCBS repeat-containing protein [Bacteroidota bacterium]